MHGAARVACEISWQSRPLSFLSVLRTVVMANPQVGAFVRQIRDKLPTHDSPEQAAEAVRTDLTNIGMPFTEEMEANFRLALAEVVASIEEVEVLRRHSLVKAPVDWYSGPNPRDCHWPALEGYLGNSKGWSAATLQSINESSTEVVSLLADPSQATFKHRGLVVGYVQSGKTANMTAVIAKAVDAGYNLIVLLGGVTNKLRAQTQRRVENDIVNRHRHLWQLYTTEADDGDYTMPANGSFTMPVPGRAQLAVMKKVTSRLESFRRTVERTPAKILKQLKVLLIDDECDQASVNASDKEHDMTRINEEIRRIINSFPAVSYVGYTATPFANVFIDPYPNPINEHELDDLYPEDFITSLPRPDDYFGAREVFGYAPEDPDGMETPAEAGRNMIRIVPEEKLDLLRPGRGTDKKTFSPQMTEELEYAVLWFLLGCAIRRSRGDSDEHMSMLVHTSQNVLQHEMMRKLIEEWLDNNKANLLKETGQSFRKLRSVFDSETGLVPLEYGPVEFSEIIPHLGEALSRLEIIVENGESLERLDYSKEPKTYIVIGGIVLARGLTLEGLTVSFFLRTSMQYDTLLQMGRWFGYRHGYEDLPRLWTTSDLADKFQALARIEEEIREDIANYRDYDITPAEFAVRVRSIPGMAITAASKMRHAYRTDISFSGRHVQTIRFDHKSNNKVAANWSAAVELVNRLMDRYQLEPKNGGRRYLATGVAYQEVRKFLMAYEISEYHMDLKKNLLLGYIDQEREALKSWNVGIVTPDSNLVSAKPLGKLGHVRANRRSQLKGEERGYADIKALMSARDILIDADDAQPASNRWVDIKAVRPRTPLLLLYVIHSKSKQQSATRADLDAVGDLIGIGIVFPGTPGKAGSYYSVELDPPEPESSDMHEESDE